MANPDWDVLESFLTQTVIKFLVNDFDLSCVTVISDEFFDLFLPVGYE